MHMKSIPALLLLAAMPAVHAATPEETAAATEKLKAEQAYYDQLIATSKSQQAANSVATALQTASITAANELNAAQLKQDLALPAAYKEAGLAAATGREGSINFSSTDKTLLALQKDSLAVTGALADAVCKDVKARLPADPAQKFFLAPANYEALVQKSLPDVIRYGTLVRAAKDANKIFANRVKLEGAAAVGGAILTAQYVAGGIQSLAKLFKTDYNLSYTSANRQVLFEQALALQCSARIVPNVEAKLRQNASEILYDGLNEMAKLMQNYDRANDQITLLKTELAAEETKWTAKKPTTRSGKAEQAKQLAALQARMKANADNEKQLVAFKATATEIRAFLAALGTSTVIDSLVWGQPYLQKIGGVPVAAPNLDVDRLIRLSYSLNVQDAAIKLTSSFRSERVRSFATAEVIYTLTAANGDPIALGAFSKSTEPAQLQLKEFKGGDYETTWVPVP
jgi:hypothetical protein